MTWLASLHGHADHANADDAAAAEAKVRDALQTIADQLVDDGHVGVAATFHGEHTGDTNLLQPDAPVDPGPPATGEAVPTTPVEAPAPGEGGDQEQEQVPGPAHDALPDQAADEGTAPEATS